VERDKAGQGKEGSMIQRNVKRKWGNDRLTKNKQPVTMGRQNRVDQNLSAVEFVLTFQSLAVTLNTTRFNIKKFYVVPTLRLRVLYGSQNKQQLCLIKR
jgi:hypothetical protein